jgi:RNA recognition motif-containing protein
VLDAFSKFGKVKSVTLKNYYAFVDYEEHEAAVEAVEKMNGTTFVNGEVLTVQ